MGAIGVITSYFLAKILPSLGVRLLVRSLGSQSEDTVTAAYMALVKLGSGYADHLLPYAREGRSTVAIIRIVGNWFDRRLIPKLLPFLTSSDAEVARVAGEVIERLRREGA